MIIYIPLEITVRELQGHLLFATHAAYRGHQVFIAHINHIWLFKRLGLLPKGPFLAKNLNVSKDNALIYKNFQESGCDIYCQEQEPSILWGAFEKFLFDFNITRNQLLPFKAVFCWGERDTHGYRCFFKSHEEIFVDTGSTRSDLWNPRYTSLREKTGNVGQKYILVVSNFSYWLGTRHWTEWFSSGRRNETLQSLHQEECLLNFFLEDSSIAFNMIKAVRHMASMYPDYRIVIRPHPLDLPLYWQRVVGDYPNIEVSDNTSPLTNWIDGASVVIQNGCTSSIETVLMKVPLISFGPERHQGDLKIPSMLGLKAETLEELDDAISACFDERLYAPIQEASEAVLKPIISTDSGDAAIRMLKIMEERSSFDPEIKIGGRGVIGFGIIRSIKNTIDRIRGAMKLIEINENQIKINHDFVIDNIKEMSQVLGLPLPKITFISKWGIIVSPFKQ